MYIENNAIEFAQLCQACNPYFYSQVKKLHSKVSELPSSHGTCSWTRSKIDCIKYNHVSNYRLLFTVTFYCIHCVLMDFCKVFSSVKKARRAHTGDRVNCVQIWNELITVLNWHVWFYSCASFAITLAVSIVPNHWLLQILL